MTEDRKSDLDYLSDIEASTNGHARVGSRGKKIGQGYFGKRSKRARCQSYGKRKSKKKVTVANV